WKSETLALSGRDARIGARAGPGIDAAPRRRRGGGATRTGDCPRPLGRWSAPAQRPGVLCGDRAERERPPGRQACLAAHPRDALPALGAGLGSRLPVPGETFREATSALVVSGAGFQPAVVSQGRLEACPTTLQYFTSFRQKVGGSFPIRRQRLAMA